MALFSLLQIAESAGTMRWFLNSWALLLTALVGQVCGYTYLMVLHTGSKSHHVVGEALAKGLTAAGHEVTLISPFPQKNPVKNLIDIDTPNTITIMEGESKYYLGVSSICHVRLIVAARHLIM